MRNRYWSPMLVSLTAIVASVSLVACSKDAQTPAPLSFPTGHPFVFYTASGPATLSPVEIADTPELRARGLMYRTSLAPNAGMEFQFDASTRETFWMKNTTIPLSIAFIGSDGTVVGIRDMPPCTTETCPTYAPDADYTLAVEANQGWFQDHDVKWGDRVGKPLP